MLTAKVIINRHMLEFAIIGTQPYKLSTDEPPLLNMVSVQNDQDEQTSASYEVGQFTSDSEMALITSAIELIGRPHGVHINRRPSGEHVSAVESRIGHIKHHVEAIRISLPYKLNVKLLEYCIKYCTTWYLLTSRVKDRHNGTCPWLLLKRRQVLFKDVCVASF